MNVSESLELTIEAPESDNWQVYLTNYRNWLMEQNISPHTKRVYLGQVQQFVMFVATSDYADSFLNGDIYSTVVNEYRSFLKNVMHVGASSINNSLIAIEHFCSMLGIPTTKIEREQRRRWTSKVLNASHQKAFLEAVKKQEQLRDQALALILFTAGIRIAECANLNIDDIIKTPNGVRLLIKRTKSSGNIEVKESGILSAEAVQALQIWLNERSSFGIDSNERALWTGQQKQRLSIAGIDFIIRRIGWNAHLMLSAEILRQTGIANAAENTSKSVVAAEIGEVVSLGAVRRIGLSGNAEYRKALQQLRGNM